MSAVHGTRCGPLEVDAFAVISASVAGALEFVFAGFPVRSASQMRASRENHEQAIRGPIHPNAVLLLPLGIYPECIVRGIPDLETRRRFEQRARQEKTEEGQEPRGKETSDGTP